MRISVNLANRPFVELGPLFARLRLAMGVLALLAIGLGFALHSLNAKAAVARAQFLNGLFAWKSFSRTAVMMDLEKVLPTGVQVTSIEPQISKEGDVNIRLRVSG